MKAPPINVLLVEENGEGNCLQEGFLEELAATDIEPVRVERVAQALRCLEGIRFHAILLRMSILSSDGLETIHRLYKKAPGVPIVVVVGRDDEAFAAQAARKGAQDYLVESEIAPSAVARTILFATERKLGDEALRQRNRELALLNRAGHLLSSTLELDRVLATVLEEMCGLLSVTAGSVWLVDSASHELVCEQATGPHREIALGCRLVVGEGLAGWVVSNGESLVVPDALVDDRHFEGIDQQTGLVLRTILGVPLRVNEQIIGVLQMMDHETDRLCVEDLALIEPLAASAAIAIENARLYRELVNHTGTLEQQVQKRTAQLQAQNVQLEAILRSAADGIVVADRDGEIHRANPVVQTWLHQDFTQADARKLREAVRDLAPRASDRPSLILALKGLDLELKAAPIAESGAMKAAAVVAIRDISHLKVLDRMRSRFVSNVSHELRTPVTTIKLYADLLKRTPMERWETYVELLAREADHQARLVEDILEISRIDVGRLGMKPRPVCLDQLIEATVANHQVLAHDRGVTLSLGAEEAGAAASPVKPSTACVDPHRMMQVLDNLVENAIRYTMEGGSVKVGIEEENTNGRAWARMTVVDTGIGIPDHELPHIFERFFRGEGPREIEATGTGLGLAIAKEVVELHGGQVNVESEVGIGSAFAVRVPMSIQPS